MTKQCLVNIKPSMFHSCCSRLCFSPRYRPMTSVANLPVFPANLGLFFLWSCGLFWRLAGWLFLGLFCWKFACFLDLFFADFCRGDCFFLFLWHFFCLNVSPKATRAFFCENMLILGLIFRMCFPVFYLIFLSNLYLVTFLARRMLGLFFV